MNAHVEVQFAVEDESVPSAEDIVLWVDRAILFAERTSGAEVSVRVVSATEMQQLNDDFREQDKPTNVLSFPAGEIEGLPADASLPLGDIVVCSAVVREEAERQGKALADHWAHMIIHGTLHLLGFDHVDDSDAAEMESLEIRILAAHGIKDPYGESPREN